MQHLSIMIIIIHSQSTCLEPPVVSGIATEYTLLIHNRRPWRSPSAYTAVNAWGLSKFVYNKYHCYWFHLYGNGCTLTIDNNISQIPMPHKLNEIDLHGRLSYIFSRSQLMKISFKRLPNTENKLQTSCRYRFWISTRLIFRVMFQAKTNKNYDRLKFPCSDHAMSHKCC